MRIALFQGKGEGLYQGVEEYVVFIEDDKEEIQDHCAVGFELAEVEEIDNKLILFPLNQSLIPML